jgi:hypothetical protein
VTKQASAGRVIEFEHMAGIRLIDNMLDVLECESLIAVAKGASLIQPDYQRYGFKLSAVDKGRYRRGVLEYSFN